MTENRAALAHCKGYPRPERGFAVCLRTEERNRLQTELETPELQPRQRESISLSILGIQRRP
jgi:hypothetical protein